MQCHKCNTAFLVKQFVFVLYSTDMFRLKRKPPSG